MKPVLTTVAVTAIQEDIVLTTVPVEVTVQENLSFFQKSSEEETKDAVHFQMRKRLNHFSTYGHRISQ